MSDLTGKTFFVTGANAGIGRATVEALAARGGNVVLASRSEEKTRPVLEALAKKWPGSKAEFLQLDLGDLRLVKAAAEQYLASGKPLDVLINNAGLAGYPGVTRDGYEITFGTNHLGPFLLTQLLLPRLQEAPQGRVVNVASRAGERVPRIRWEWLEGPIDSTRGRISQYGISKLMNVLHAKELARRLTGTRVTTYSLHPGVVASELWRKLPGPLESLIKLFMISNEEGAKTSVYCATAPELSQVTGRYYDKCKERRPNPLADDEQLAGKLWQRSEELVRATLG